MASEKRKRSIFAVGWAKDSDKKKNEPEKIVSHALNPLKCLAKHSQTIHRQQQTYCLSVFDHFVGLPLIGTNMYQC